MTTEQAPVSGRKTQRIRDVRLITVVPSRGTVPHLADIDETAPGTVLLRGSASDNALWLAMPGVEAIFS